MENLYENIFGGQSIVFYVSWMLFSLLGFLIHKYIMFQRRGGVKRPFKLYYFLSDNAYDIIFGAITMFIIGRFQEDLNAYLKPEWMIENIMLKATVFGFLFTFLVQLVRKTKFGKILKSSKFPDGANRD